MWVKRADSHNYLSDHGYSVVDYCLISSDFSDCVERLVVTDRNESDHVPV